ncbi:MerR family transcriptional regulator [Pseudoduganella umbonata]|nr:MerR family transcriptional regulator [Pseudoduganella umbonata]
MKIGELAARSGMAASTIRYYEQEGLLPKASRGANGYRVYEEAALEQLNLIDTGQRLGFSLDAIRGVLKLQGEALQDGLMQGLDARLGEIDAMIGTLQAQRQALLDSRERLRGAWAQGQCMNRAELAQKSQYCEGEGEPGAGVGRDVKAA